VRVGLPEGLERKLNGPVTFLHIGRDRNGGRRNGKLPMTSIFPSPKMKIAVMRNLGRRSLAGIMRGIALEAR